MIIYTVPIEEDTIEHCMNKNPKKQIKQAMK